MHEHSLTNQPTNQPTLAIASKGTDSNLSLIISQNPSGIFQNAHILKQYCTSSSTGALLVIGWYDWIWRLRLEYRRCNDGLVRQIMLADMGSRMRYIYIWVGRKERLDEVDI